MQGIARREMESARRLRNDEGKKKYQKKVRSNAHLQGSR